MCSNVIIHLKQVVKSFKIIKRYSQQVYLIVCITMRIMIYKELLEIQDYDTGENKRSS